MLNGFSKENHFHMVIFSSAISSINFNLSIYLDDHFEIGSKGAVHTLTIRKVAWNEGGEYKCIADGGAKTSATLIVKGKSLFSFLFLSNILFSNTGNIHKTS
jgi:hypothetical protein